MKVDLYLGDCLHTLRKLPDNSVDSIVTDPPYGLSKQPDMTEVLRHWLAGDDYTHTGGGFMGKSWDSFVPGPSIWRECLRVLKPGGHLLAFAGTRTMDLMGLSLRLAGFELRDSIGYAHDDESDGAPLLAWCFGSGFPKNLDVSKAIDGKLTTGRSDSIALREVNEPRPGEATVRAQSQNGHAGFVGSGSVGPSVKRDTPATDAARQWKGWGTALKPSHEPVIIACKPLDEGGKWATIASELLQLGGKLWSMLSASVAESSFGLSQSEFDAACASARWSAEEKCSTRDALLEVMGMSQFELATVSSLNTVSSWLRILGEVSQRENTSIIETASSTTIDWKTLRFLASKITPLTIIRGHKSGAWSPANACIAAKSLSATVATLNATLELSALAPVTSQWLEDCRVEGAKSLSPRLDPILVARKPLAGTVAENVQQFGTGAINVDGCRIEAEKQTGWGGGGSKLYDGGLSREGGEPRPTDLGRWPANLVHDGSEAVVSLFPANAGASAPVTGNEQSEASTGKVTGKRARVVGAFHADKGSAARFFYCAKASKRDRDEGCTALPVTSAADMVERDEGSDGMNSPRAGAGRTSGARNFHPTVKPTELMRWLVRLVTPPGGVVLDPFTGSGSTGKAAVLEGFDFIGCELGPDYMRIAVARIGHVMNAGKPRVILNACEVPK